MGEAPDPTTSDAPRSIEVWHPKREVAMTALFSVALLVLGVSFAIVDEHAMSKIVGLVVVAGGFVAIWFVRRMAFEPRFIADDLGIRTDSGMRIRWEDIDAICPTPYTLPSEYSSYQRTLYAGLALPPSRTVTLHVVLRDPVSFWRGRRLRDDERIVDVGTIPILDLPVSLEAFYAFLRARSRFEIIVFDG